MILIIDSPNLAFRSYHVMSSLRSSKGYPTGMMYGFFSILDSYADLVSNKIILCWEGGNTWRKTKYPEYKASRKEREPEIAIGFNDLKQICDYTGITQVQKVGYESDDVIASLVHLLDKDVRIITGDKDLLQLIDSEKNIKVLRPSTKHGLVEYNEQMVEEEFGVPFNLLPEYLSICGDKSDNIPGLRGWGEVKTSKFLNSEKNPLETLYTMFPTEAEKLKLFYELILLKNSPSLTREDFRLTEPNIYKLTLKLFEYEIKTLTGPELVETYYNQEFTESILKLL